MLLYCWGVMRLFATLVLSALLVAACGGSASSGGAAAVPVDGTQTTASPLEEALGFPSEPGQRQYQLIAMQRDADASIIECMRTAGFFYAVDAAETRFQSGASVGDGSMAWTAGNGLGITQSFIAALAADANQGASSLNLDYVASLTSQEAAAYDQALVGGVEPSPGDVAYQPGGCWAQAFTPILEQLALIQALEAELELMNTRLASDPRVREYQAEWSVCMSALGHQYSNERAMADDMYARLLDIELVEVDGAMRVVSPDALDGLLALERSVALDSFGCRQSFVQDLKELRDNYEREFLEDNRFEIAALLSPDTE